jgi:hypothetical protein
MVAQTGDMRRKSTEPDTPELTTRSGIPSLIVYEEVVLVGIRLESQRRIVDGQSYR